MRIFVLGGGPGGLYAAMLLKKAHPDWAVEVVERNPPDATYGWGIVFSDRTLSSFHEADPSSYKDILDHFVLWDLVEVRHGDEVIRCGGNVFAGMSRKVLLELLQRRAREVGVRLAFQTEIEDPSRLSDYDLIIAADGINSIVRRTWEADFGPRLHFGKAKYAWFGTDQVFDAFTFIFRATGHGLFQAHVYPHIGSVATMVIECAESTWRSAGLDQASEDESVAFCENIFRRDLAAGRIHANKSDWLSFPTIRNRTWRRGNVVLLGDAAHTAHFGIGSGTKLAMEDAIALAKGFERHGEDLDRALGEYELERRPVVEALQEAALQSQEYFESTSRYVRFKGLPFAFHLLTRSSRTSYDELRRRDPAFVDRVDRGYFEDHANGVAPPGSRLLAPPPCFTPLHLRDLHLPNRVVLSPPTSESAQDGVSSEAASARLIRCALGGAGLVMTEVMAVSPEGRITPGCPGIYRPESASALRRLAEFLHTRTEVKLAAQIGHAGRRGSTRPRSKGLDRPLGRGAWPLLSASAIPYGSGRPVPKGMDRTDMDRVRDDFVRAARAADQAGVDLLQLHCAQGYLLWSFLSPLSNRRTDACGGSFERRAAFPLEVFDAVRAVWPEAKPLAVALSASDWVADGLGPDEVVAFADTLRRRGCDLVQVITGLVQLEGTPKYDPYFSTLFSDRVRNEAEVPTLVAARSGTSDEMNSILAGGRGDLCMLRPRGLDEIRAA